MEDKMKNKATSPENFEKITALAAREFLQTARRRSKKGAGRGLP